MKLETFGEGESWHLKIPQRQGRGRGGLKTTPWEEGKAGKAMSHFSGAVALTRNLNTYGVISVFRAKETDMSGQGHV